MYEFLTNVVAVAFVLGVLVFIHEFGHYAAAKYFKVRVEAFSIGFGKRLFGFKKGDTDYRISMLPLGGYVKMAGENPFEPSTGDPGEFMSHSRWQRFVIAIAGPAMNVIFSVIVLAGIFMVHYEHPYYSDQPSNVGWPREKSPAEKAGLRQGDRIIRLDGIDNPDWEATNRRIMISAGQPLDLMVRRGDQVFQVPLTPEAVGPDRIGDAGLVPFMPAVAAEVEPNHPAAVSGIRSGDQIVAFSGKTINSMAAFQHWVQINKDNPADITVLRNGQEMHFQIKPFQDEIEGEKLYRIGISNPTHVDHLPLTQALSRSVAWNVEQSKTLFVILKRMAQRKISVKQMSGPVGIAQVSGQAARQGWLQLVMLMVFISLQLGLFNLLPIPILDGGLILMLLIEGFLRRDIRREVKELVYQAAFVFLVLFAVVVIISDISKTGVGKSIGLP